MRILLWNCLRKDNFMTLKECRRLAKLFPERYKLTCAYARGVGEWLYL